MQRFERMELVGYSLQTMQEKVNSILKDHGAYSLPVDIVHVVQQDGFRIYKMILNKNMTGALLVDDTEKIGKTDANRLIIVDNDAGRERGRYISAHEYGHFVLHRSDSKTQFAHRDYLHDEDDAEREADLFARSILMPIDLLKEALKKKQMNSSEKMQEEDVIMFIMERCDVTAKKAMKRFFELKNEGIFAFD